MFDVALLKVIGGELFGSPERARDLSSLRAISDADMLAAMAGGGSEQGRTAAGYLYQTIQISRAIQYADRVLDIGCGTGVQLLQLARVAPDVTFVGIDTSDTLLEAARSAAERHQLANVRFAKMDCQRLAAIETGSMAAVISTMTIHHLASAQAMTDCFAEMVRVLQPTGAIYVEDFCRLKRSGSVDYFVERGACGARDPFSNLYEASMRAAFSKDEIARCVKQCLPASVDLFATVPIPFLCVVATPLGTLSAQQERVIGRMYWSLNEAQRRDFKDLALAFRLAGLELPRGLIRRLADTR